MRFFVLIFCVAILSCDEQKSEIIYQSEDLEIIRLSDHSYLHRSFLETESFGKVACNGLIYVNEGEAAVFDTPINDEVSNELIEWIESEQSALVKYVIINHFHNDCLGGLNAFHERGATSYANEVTKRMSFVMNYESPQHIFKEEQTLVVGKAELINYFPGKAHTIDNIISYIPAERLLFGGCMVKSLGAGKGNLADADTLQWSNSILAIKSRFPEIETVIPGHGKYGGTELLDFTIEMFEQE